MAKKPDFDLAFGVGDDPKSVLRAFRLDVWDNKIVAWRETEREADVTALAADRAGPRAHPPASPGRPGERANDGLVPFR